MNSSQTTHLLRCLLFITPQLRLPSQAEHIWLPPLPVWWWWWWCSKPDRRGDRAFGSTGGMEGWKLESRDIYIYVRQVKWSWELRSHPAGWLGGSGRCGWTSGSASPATLLRAPSFTALFGETHTHKKSKGVLFDSAEAGNVAPNVYLRLHQAAACWGWAPRCPAEAASCASPPLWRCRLAAGDQKINKTNTQRVFKTIPKTQAD